MSKGYSCYLDLIRLLASAMVFGHHAMVNFGCYEPAEACPVGRAMFPWQAGHDAVVVFFVLSGYVITYVASEREFKLREFAISRIARIYSVAIPAIALTVLVDVSLLAVGKGAGVVPIYQYHAPWKYLPLFLSFTTDFWFLGELTFSDGGFWSLCYEVWYYILFASIFYFGGRRRWLLASLIFLLMGPKLWALLLTWVLGSVVYRRQRRSAMSAGTARTVFLLSIAALIFVLQFEATVGIDRLVDDLSGHWVSVHMKYSQWFAGDTIIAAIFAINLFAAKYAKLEFGAFAAPIKFLASFSFTLYLAHGPLLSFWTLYVGTGMFQTIVAIVGCVAVLGMATEHQKGRLHQLLSRMPLAVRV